MREFSVPNGMARSIWDNKYSRKKLDGTYQSWAERVSEVVDGNFLLDPRVHDAKSKDSPVVKEWVRTKELAVAGVFATSGRHLQHGDHDQPGRKIELHSNCATAFTSFMLQRCLLSGAGVGRDYSAAVCRVDWSRAPNIRLVLDESHPDFDVDRFQGFFEPLRDARHKYASESESVRWFTVEDTREGWSKVTEIIETAAWQGRHADKLFIFDFSEVRGRGQPIMGMQGRPASGPLPLMDALAKVASIKHAGMPCWKQALFIDHYIAACVHFGGARRAARMAVKSWRDRDIIDFIDVKRGGFLWSANNSILVDAEFWEQARSARHSHGRRVFEAAVNAAYFDSTGEPGFINIDKLNTNREGMEFITGENCINPETYADLHKKTKEMLDNTLEHVKKLERPFLTNPCGEVVLSTYGGLCLIGDICLSQAMTKEEALDASGLMSRFLIRCNLMRSDYAAEIKRTNRVGVSLTGIHEFAWNHFGLSFRDMIYAPDDPLHFRHEAANEFWAFIDQMRERACSEAAEFSKEIGMVVPHTTTCLKPSGTVSKVLNCTEGAHLPALAYYLRYVQYQYDDPAVPELVARGYPMEDISHRYHNQVIVGFPTKQPIVDLMGEMVTTADETTPEENFRWLQLLEQHWLGGPNENGQLSFTLKYSTKTTSYDEYMALILKWQPTVRCVAIMPQSDWRESKKIYGYVPEQPITKEEYDSMMANITAPVEREAYSDESLICASGVCPIEADR